MLIGLDFDNTIVCYDGAIATFAEESFELPPATPRTKVGLRDHLRHLGREAEWTAFQGELYGPGMRYAEPFEGAIETMKALVIRGHQLVIISHRSLRPYAGPPHDLHAAARSWVGTRLQALGLFADGAVNFLESREAKVATIARLGCDVFLDDLPEVLEARGFPERTLGILFDPAGEQTAQPGLSRITTWAQLLGVVPGLA